MLKFGIIGFGGLGKVHFNNYQFVKEHKDIKLVAICDVEESAFKSKTSTNLGEDSSVLDFTGINLYNDACEMLEKEELDFVISALPTYLHEKYAVMAMEKGIHVFSEKPMALTFEQGKHMLEVSKKNNVKLMIGQCVRYFPHYVKLKEIIESKEYGKIIDAEFNRLSLTPVWGWQNWFMDESLSGGAVLDLHVHDVDFINYVFGRPKAICSIATNQVSRHDSITTLYYYDDVAVTARGSWGESDSFDFHTPFRARFENATIECIEGVYTVYPQGGEPFNLEVGTEDGYVAEIIDFINCIENDTESKINPPESSLQTIEIALAEKKSADSMEVVKL